MNTANELMKTVELLAQASQAARMNKFLANQMPLAALDTLYSIDPKSFESEWGAYFYSSLIKDTVDDLLVRARWAFDKAVGEFNIHRSSDDKPTYSNVDMQDFQDRIFAIIQMIGGLSKSIRAEELTGASITSTHIDVMMEHLALDWDIRTDWHDALLNFV